MLSKETKIADLSELNHFEKRKLSKSGYNTVGDLVDNKNIDFIDSCRIREKTNQKIQLIINEILYQEEIIEKKNCEIEKSISSENSLSMIEIKRKSPIDWEKRFQAYANENNVIYAKEIPSNIKRNFRDYAYKTLNMSIVDVAKIYGYTWVSNRKSVNWNERFQTYADENNIIYAKDIPSDMKSKFSAYAHKTCNMSIVDVAKSYGYTWIPAYQGRTLTGKIDWNEKFQTYADENNIIEATKVPKNIKQSIYHHARNMFEMSTIEFAESLGYTWIPAPKGGKKGRKLPEKIDWNERLQTYADKNNVIKATNIPKNAKKKIYRHAHEILGISTIEFAESLGYTWIPGQRGHHSKSYYTKTSATCLLKDNIVYNNLVCLEDNSKYQKLYRTAKHHEMKIGEYVKSLGFDWEPRLVILLNNIHAESKDAYVSAESDYYKSLKYYAKKYDSTLDDFCAKYGITIVAD